MTKNKQKYIYTWIALGMMILAASLLLILSSFDFNSQNIQLVLSIFAWIAILAPGVYLFLAASNRSLNVLKDGTEQGETINKSIEKNTSPAQNTTEHLDIQSIAKKIVRRVNPNDNPEKWSLQLLKQLVVEIEIMSGIFYIRNDKNIFESASTYAYPLSTEPYTFAEGEGLSGQVAKNKQISIYRSIPDDYKEVFSGLGKGKPSYLAIVPILIDDITIAVMEMAGFKWSEEKLEQLFQIIARGLSEKIQENNNE